MALGNLNRVDKSTAERWVYVYKLTRNVELALERNTVRHNGIFLNSTWRTENGVKWLFVHQEGYQEKSPPNYIQKYILTI